MKSLEPHFQNETEVNIDVIEKAEENLNNHSKLLAKIINLGSNAGENQQSRCAATLKVQQTKIPALQGTRKDHKANTCPIEGPPCRPLVAATHAPNAPISNLLAKVLKDVGNDLANQIRTEATGSEEICRDMDDHNAKINSTNPNPNITIGSLDVKQLYPNISKKLAATAVKRAVKRMKIEPTNINQEVLIRYVALTTTREVLQEAKVEEYEGTIYKFKA